MSTESVPGTCQVTLLGGATLSGTGLNRMLLERKLAACFAYLVLEGPTFRARMADLLWPESPEATARNNLSQMLRKVRLTTGRDLITPGNPIAVAGDLNVDVARVRDLFARGQYAELVGLNPALLPGLNYDDCPDLDDWVRSEREILEGWWIQALSHESARLEREGDLGAALELAGRLLTADPVSEDVYRRVMRLQYARGDRAAALRAYGRCVEMLRREFGAEPLAETQALGREIDQGTLNVPVGATARHALPLAVLRPPRLLGREREWTMMEDAYTRGLWIFIGGEAGSGKTRLALDFAASKGETRVNSARPGDQTQPWATSIRHLREGLRQQPDLPLALEPWVRLELSRLLPELTVNGQEPPPIVNEEEMLRLRHAVFHFQLALHEGAQTSVADDWQYFDQQTNTNGQYLYGPASRGRSSRSLPPLIVTYRPSELPQESWALLRQFVVQGLAVSITLGSLDKNSLGALMDDLEVPNDVPTRNRLVQHTGGNPVFLLETVKHLIETGQFGESLPERLPLPVKVAQVIEQRLNGLSTPALQAARAAAILQRDFTVDLVADMLGAPLLELLEAWGELESAQVVRGDGFWHDLIYEAVAAQIPSSVQTLLHRNAARALERSGANPLRIAQHWLSGENAQAALPHLRAAERAARDNFRLDDAQLLRERIAEIGRETGELDAPEPRPHSLPLPSTSFHGREAARVEVEGLLAAGTRLLTLTGPGGVGKTRLALEVARAAQSRYESGMTFVSLADLTDPRGLAAALMNGFGLPMGSPDDPLAALNRDLGQKRHLLVLDNLEQVVEGAAVLAQMLRAAPGLQLLVTSRIPLSLSGERVYAVEPLPLSNSFQGDPQEALSRSSVLALFVDRAQAVSPSFRLTPQNLPVIGAILRQLDGLPLAIELAAARLRAMPPAMLQSRLERALPVLVHGARDLPDRHRTLRATIAWSMTLLPEAERTLLGRLSVFKGGWTLDAAEQVADATGTLDVLERLGTLIEHSLVRWTEESGLEPRYTMLATVREYAREELEASGELAEVRRLHGEFMLDFMRRAAEGVSGSGQKRWVQDLEGEMSNVFAALDTLTGTGQLEDAAELAELICLMAPLNPWFIEGVHALTPLVEHPALDSLTNRAQARIALARGLRAFWQQDLTGTETFMTEGTRRYADEGEVVGQVLALGYRTFAVMQQGRLDEAERLSRDSIALAEAHGDPFITSMALHARMIVPQVRQDAPEITRLSWRMHEVALQTDSTFMLMMARIHLARGERLAGQFEEAAAHLTQAGLHATALDSGMGCLTVLTGWAQLALARGDGSALGWLTGVLECQRELQYANWDSENGTTLAQVERTAQLLLGSDLFSERRERGREAGLQEALTLLARGQGQPK
ncbi:BTAD domain-containing putative transcriptional regulator [Deinococcus oregonensis]|uniref:BTAD domain-containing putative transcriptional regulator n=1 Tax=Deinococcus oregonensis TaxID=1805970 RepID=A0ABV6B4N8_9DEIO